MKPVDLDTIMRLLFHNMPHVYWKSIDGKCQDGNVTREFDLPIDSMIGKPVFEVLADSPKFATTITEVDNRVMRENITLTLEEKNPNLNGPGEKVYLSQKNPIHDQSGKVIGMLGFSVDITESKQQETILKQERDKLLENTSRAVHDIRSPVASLLMLIKSITEIPEKERITLRDVAVTIQDIANNLLSQYECTVPPQNFNRTENQPILASTNLLQILAEKKLQYKNSAVTFDYQFSAASNFVFINIEPVIFKSMISNIINNAVEACHRQAGKVMLALSVGKETVKIVVQDDGKGIDADLLNKINNNIAITAGKSTGHGLGLVQVRETLRANRGQLLIDSMPGSGTKIILTLPQIKPPNWIAKEIKLKNTDTIIILDDDKSIHSAWDAYFTVILSKMPNLHIKHFSEGSAVLEYINGLTLLEKKHIFLLTDYELLKQTDNGLDIIIKSGIGLQRTILVTSHYANKTVLKKAAAIGVKILPKQLALEVLVKVEAAPPQHARPSGHLTNLVLVDDNVLFTKAIQLYLKNRSKIDIYHNPHEFIKRLHKYPMHTRICLDNDFKLPNIDGITLIKRLHKQGYTNLCLLSGKNFQPSELPDDVKFVMKTDLESISKL